MFKYDYDSNNIPNVFSSNYYIGFFKQSNVEGKNITIQNVYI